MINTSKYYQTVIDFLNEHLKSSFKPDDVIDVFAKLYVQIQADKDLSDEDQMTLCDLCQESVELVDDVSEKKLFIDQFSENFQQKINEHDEVSHSTKP